MLEIIKKDNKTLYGESFFHSSTHKTLVLCHGLNTDHNYPLLQSIVNYFKEDYNIFNFDFRGQGHSSGDYHTITLGNQVEDVEDIIDYIHKQYNIALSDITLIGHSQGGMVAMLWAARSKIQLDHLILISPGFGIVEACRKGNFAGITFNLETMGDHLDVLLGCVLPRRYIEEAKDINLKEELEDYPYPVIIFYSPNDELVSVADLHKGSDYLKHKTMYEFSSNHHYLNEYDKVNKCLTTCLKHV